MVSKIIDSPTYGQFWTLSSDFGGFDTDTSYASLPWGNSRPGQAVTGERLAAMQAPAALTLPPAPQPLVDPPQNRVGRPAPPFARYLIKLSAREQAGQRLLLNLRRFGHRASRTAPLEEFPTQIGPIRKPQRLGLRPANPRHGGNLFPGCSTAASGMRRLPR